MIPSVFLQIWCVEFVQSNSSTWIHEISGNLKSKIKKLRFRMSQMNTITLNTGLRDPIHTRAINTESPHSRESELLAFT